MPQISSDAIRRAEGSRPEQWPRNLPETKVPRARRYLELNRDTLPIQRRALSPLQTLLALRSSTPALQTGTEQLLHANKNTLVYVRTLPASTHGIQRILVGVNKGSEAADVWGKTDETEIQNAVREVAVPLGSPGLDLCEDRHSLRIHLAANGTVISDLD